MAAVDDAARGQAGPRARGGLGDGAGAEEAGAAAAAAAAARRAGGEAGGTDAEDRGARGARRRSMVGDGKR